MFGDDFMKKMIIVDEEGNDVHNHNRNRLISNKFLEWLLYMIGYAIVLILVSCLFKSFYISNHYYGVFALVAAIIIYILNQTIKPVLFYITLPITAITMGLFYPIINVLILYITSFILGDNFRIEGFFIPFVIAVLISFLNMVMEGMVIKPIIHRSKK